MVVPSKSVTLACALKCPSADAITVKDPAGAIKLNEPSGFVIAEAANVVSGLNKLILTGFFAITCPASMGAERGVAVGAEKSATVMESGMDAMLSRE